MKNDDTTPKSDPTPTTEPSSKPSPLATFKTNRTLQIATAVVAIALVGGGLAFALTRTKTTPKNDQPTQNADQQTSEGSSAFMQQYGQGCQKRDVTFSSAPMKLSDLAIIRPIGAMNDGHVTPTDHVYIGGPDMNAADNTYPVLMPADGTITHVSAMPAQYIGDRAGQQVAVEDHRIVISHSCRYYSIYIHIHKLGDKLSSVVGKLQPNEGKQTSIELKAGEIVGYIGGSTFDWTPIDTETKLAGFITPSLYDGEPWKIHTVSPFDLYKEPLKSQLESKSLRSVAPLGGKIDYDQPGKLIGNWFREGSGGYSGKENNGGRYYDAHLSVVPDYIDPAGTIVSIGNWNNVSKQLAVSTGVDPAGVTTDSGPVKYELAGYSYNLPNGGSWNMNSVAKGLKLVPNANVEGTIMFQVLPGEKLKVEKFPGKRASQVTAFTTAAQMYER